MHTIKSFSFAADSLAFDPDPGRRRLLISGQDNRVHLWDESTDQSQSLASTGHGPFAFRPDGTALQFVIAKDRSSVELRDVSASRILRTFRSPVEGRSAVTGWTVSPDGSRVAVAIQIVQDQGKAANKEGTLVVWEAESGRVLLKTLTRRPTDVALTPGGRLLAAGDEEGRVSVWDVAAGNLIATLSAGSTSRTGINCLAFSPDPLRNERKDRPGSGWLLAAGHSGGVVIVWDIGDRVPRSYCRGSSYGVHAVAFSPDSTKLASCGRFEVKLWDVATGRFLLGLRGGNYLVGLAFVPEGKKLAVAKMAAFSHPDGVDVWEIEDGRGIRTMWGLTNRIEKIVFSPDGRRLAALTDNWQVGIWDRVDGRLVQVLDVPPGFLSDNAGLAFSPDAHRLVFSSGREARLWDLETGAEQGKWTLPAGLNDLLVFRGPNQLLLCRVETKDGRGAPLGGFNPHEFPRVCVIRNLFGSNPTHPLAVIEDFNWYVNGSCISADGSYYAVQGLSGSSGTLVRSIRLYEGINGKHLWTIPSQRSADDLGGTMLFDVPGRLLGVNLTQTKGRNDCTLLAIPSGIVSGTIDPFPGSLGPNAERWLSSRYVTREAPAGFGIHERGRKNPLITFIQDVPTGGLATSADWRDLAWGHADGTVSLANLMEVQRRLASIGLGW